MKKNRKTITALLIICEGQATEPNYFGWLAEKYAYDNNLEVIIRPNEKYNQQSINNDNEKHSTRNKRKKKFITSTKDTSKKKKRNFLKEIKDILEEKQLDTKVPLNYINFAIELIKEQQEFDKQIMDIEDRKIIEALKVNEDDLELIFDEIWTVYDKDEHPAHIEALAKAKQEKQALPFHVILSSRSFEMWLLLHFERLDDYFIKTECKEDMLNDKGEVVRDAEGNKKQKPVGCSLESKVNYEKNCEGQLCLVGYLRKNTPLRNYAKSDNDKDLKQMMNLLLHEKQLTTAFENSSWIRYISKDKTKEVCILVNNYLQNNQYSSISRWEVSYTDVDLLVKRILGIHTKHIWAEFGQEIDFAEMKNVKLSLLGNSVIEFVANEIRINPHNNSIKIYVKDLDRNIQPLQAVEEFSIIRRNNKFTIQLPENQIFNDLYFEVGNEILLLELPKKQ